MPFKLKFSANISTLFQDESIINRVRKAKGLGFQYAEAQFLYRIPRKDLAALRNETALEMVLINSPIITRDCDFVYEKAYGLACIPGLEGEFLKSLEKSIALATALRCKNIHILAGLKVGNRDIDESFATFVRNMAAADELLKKHNIVGLIKPICPQVKENYFLNSFKTATDVISEFRSSNLKLLLDLYHLYMLEYDIETGIRSYLKYTGHVQVSQGPGRQEPFYPGDIDYGMVFALLEELNYDGYIGLNYTPSDPQRGFNWLRRYQVA